METRASAGGLARRAAGVFGFLVCLAAFSMQTCSQVVHARQQADVTGPWPGADSDVTVKTYEDANHLFIPARTGVPAEYATLDTVFVPGLLDDISAWIADRTKR